MRNLSYSFAPDGTYFVFDLDTGQVIWKNIPNVKQARSQWIAQRGK